jgi:hypothetical protein
MMVCGKVKRVSLRQREKILRVKRIVRDSGPNVKKRFYGRKFTNVHNKLECLSMAVMFMGEALSGST